ncbi:hypothetical protein [Cellvibrio fibrivorans]|uniref:Phage abortive infection protein n=1 Tax=Cellvibrio fibrivorans TaxID=126350 RepID=A0ABU1V3K5_9GAMM|nr:hypothetical protein [Cellvibrio fibrivorans]MDR7092046.1 hypothetical protein [Cellvibrio fibrivorans]
MTESKPQESCITIIKEWCIDLYKAPCFWLKVITLTFLIGLAAIGLYQIVTSAFHYFSEPLSYFDPERLGQLGDFLGGTLNPMFGFATVCLLLWSIFIQRKELIFAANELHETTTALTQQLVHSKNESARNQLSDVLNKEYDKHENILLETFKLPNDDGHLDIRTLNGFGNLYEMANGFLPYDFSLHLHNAFENFNVYKNPLTSIDKDLSAAILIMVKAKSSIGTLERITKEILNICDVESVETYWFLKFYDAANDCKQIGVISEITFEKIIWDMQARRKLLVKDNFPTSQKEA